MPTRARHPAGPEGPAPSPDPGWLHPGTQVGEYQITQLVASGGMGQVYAAVHPVIAKPAAVKVLHPAISQHPVAVERFVREARAVNQIQHPNLVDIFSFGSLADGRAYYIMEWLAGDTLAVLLRRQRPSLFELTDLLDQLAAALQAVHVAGFVHCDVKPDNVVLVQRPGEPDRVKLLDFGIAHLTESSGIIETEGGVAGTPGYLSPEQALGGVLQASSDVFSLGVLAFETVTGQLPTPQEPGGIAAGLEAGVPGLPLALALLIEQMMTALPGERPDLSQVRACLASTGAAVSRPEDRVGRRWTGQLLPVGEPLALGAAGPRETMAYGSPGAAVLLQQAPALPPPLPVDLDDDLPARPPRHRLQALLGSMAVLGLVAALAWGILSRPAQERLAPVPLAAPAATLKPAPVPTAAPAAAPAAEAPAAAAVVPPNDAGSGAAPPAVATAETPTAAEVAPRPVARARRRVRARSARSSSVGRAATGPGDTGEGREARRQRPVGDPGERSEPASLPLPLPAPRPDPGRDYVFDPFGNAR